MSLMSSMSVSEGSDIDICATLTTVPEEATLEKSISITFQVDVDTGKAL